MEPKIEIIPAILPNDFSDLEEKLSLLAGAAKMVQIDICDGKFVHNATWPYKKQDLNFEKIINEEMGMPEWERMDFEFDLMINLSDPEIIRNWVSAGASRLVVHAEAKGDLKRALELAEGAELGMALNIDTPVEALNPFIDYVGFVQCMGIDNIGYQGQKFDPKVIEKINDIKRHYDLPVSVDGGVTLENAPELIQAGARRLIVGSAIIGDDNPIESLKQFKRIGKMAT